MENSMFTLPSVRSYRSGFVMKLRDFAVIFNGRVFIFIF